jgi:GntR family transcriptional regulator/MocR family aminotransferase
MRTPLQLAIDPRQATPLFVQIATSIADQIRLGRLASGDVLPGTRSLARELGVDRDTVLAAYGDLEAQGFVVTVPRAGTVIAELGIPTRGGTRRDPRTQLGFALDRGPPALVTPPAIANPPRGPFVASAAPRSDGLGAIRPIALATGVPDLRLVPGELIARAYRRAMRRHPKVVFGYSTSTLGHERLRAAIASLVRETRGIAATADDVMVTRGSQMALDLVTRAVIRPGEVVAVEELGYQPAWASFERAGAKVVGVPVDAGGMDTAALERVCAKHPVRMIYATPHHQFPTTAILAAGRRMQLLALARRHRIAILEDDYDHEFHYEGRPVLPLASTDTSGNVVYVGTLSKVLAPGLRLGFVIAPRPLIDRLARERYFIDRQGDLALELAIAELIEDDELGRHVRKMRRIYHARRDLLASLLAKTFGDRLAFRIPSGGMALWSEVAPPLDADRWVARGLTHGVAFQPGSSFSLTRRPVAAARFGFAACSEAEIQLAVRRLDKAAKLA